MPRKYPPIFDGINDVDQATGLRHFEEREVSTGEVLIREGEPARSLVCVLDGELQIRSGDTVFGTATEGDLVGEMALFERTVRTASVVAAKPTRILVLPLEGYERLRDVMHPLGAALEHHALKLQTERMRAVGDRIAALAEGTHAAFNSPTDRFFQALKTLFGMGGLSVVVELNPIATLRYSTIFADAPLEALKQIAQVFSLAAFAPGHVLITEGEMGHEMYILAEGEVDVVVATREGKVQHLATLEQGAAFGMLSLAQDRPRMATCVAKTKVGLMVLDRKGWDYIVNEPYLAGSTFRRALLRGMTDQIAASNRQLADFESRAKEGEEALRMAVAAVDTHGSTVRR
jgi:CRP-like cAMP-binding protein